MCINMFKEVVDLQLPGYQCKVPLGTVGQLAFDATSAHIWYSEFIETITKAIGNRYFPIYRMADGEFIFCVGRRPDYPPVNASYPIRMKFFAKRYLSPLSKYIKVDNLGSEGKQYEVSQRSRVQSEINIGKRIGGMQRYVSDLKKISNMGMLALHFTRTPGRFCEQYIDVMCDWFNNNGVALNKKNYIPFYFVYALLCGPYRKKILSGRRVLVVTSANDSKRINISKSLIKLGAHDAQFLNISSDKALIESLDLTKINGSVDIVLVAAGIGSANILSQLEPLATVCIDVGFVIEVLANPNLKSERIFIQCDTDD